MTDFLDTVGTAVRHTPLWVWALYVVLLFLGLQRTRDSVVALWRMLTLPVVVAVLAMVSFVTAGVNALPVMLLGLVLGFAIGLKFEPSGSARRMSDARIWLRGEWLTFALIFLVLMVRYAINVVAAMDPSLNVEPRWHYPTLGLSAGLSGIFLGRTAARLRACYRKPATMA